MLSTKDYLAMFHKGSTDKVGSKSVTDRLKQTAGEWQSKIHRLEQEAFTGMDNFCDNEAHRIETLVNQDYAVVGPVSCQYKVENGMGWVRIYFKMQVSLGQDAGAGAFLNQMLGFRLGRGDLLKKTSRDGQHQVWVVDTEIATAGF